MTSLSELDAPDERRRTSPSFYIVMGLVILAIVGTSAFFAANRAHVSTTIPNLESWPETVSQTEETVLVIPVDDAETEEALVFILPELADREEIASVLADGDGFVELAREKVDGPGPLEIAIPPVSKWDGINADDLGDDEFLILIHLSGGPGSDRYLAQDTRIETQQAALALASDRPLYQPGQTMLLRAVAVDADDGTPLDQQDIHWQIHDPRGNLVFDQTDQSSENGVATTEFDLADRSLQGDYEISVQSGDEIYRQSVAVQPFRLPRFSLSLSTNADHIMPGQSLDWRAEANYIYGDPLADHELIATLTWTDEEGTEDTLDVAGRTDDEGIHLGNSQIPETVAPGSDIRLHAVITTDAGERQEESLDISVGTQWPSVEILPLGRTTVAGDQENSAVAIVTGPDGTPLANEEIVVDVAEPDGTRATELSTDSRGRAVFGWQTPEIGYGTSSLFVDVSLPGLDAPKETVAISVTDAAFSERQFIRSRTPRAFAGGPYELDIISHDEPISIVLWSGGRVLFTDFLEASDENYQHTIDLPEDVLGLVRIAVVSRQGMVDELPVWVSETDSAEVSVEPEASQYAPGDVGWISLSFPVADDDPGPEPVTFGAVAVDEALYLLKERAQIPFELLLRQAPSTLESVLPLLDGLDDEDELGQQIIATRFLQALRSAEVAEYGSRTEHKIAEFSSGSDFTAKVHREKTRRYNTLFAIALLALLYALIGTVALFTWRLPREAEFTRRNIGLVLASAVAGAGLATGVAQMMSYDAADTLFAIACAVFVISAIYFGQRERDLPAFPWLFSVVAMIGVAYYMAKFTNRYLYDISWEYNDAFIVVYLVIPAVAFSFSTLFWSLVHFTRDHKVIGAISAAYLGTIVLGIVLVIANMFSDPIQDGELMTQQSSDRFAEFMVDDDATDEGGSISEPSAKITRSWFPETMIWEPEVTSDANGEARFSFPVPDSITTWRVNAWAHSKDGRFGSGQADLVVTRPLFVDLNLPANLIVGDEMRVPVTVVNNTDEAAEVRLTSRASGALHTSASDSGLHRIDADSRQTVTFSVSAIEVGDGELTVDLYSGDTHVDGERRSVIVAPHGRIIEDSHAGFVGDGADHAFQIPDYAVDNTAAIEATIFPGIFADVLEGLDGMLRQPNGCFEQTSSINFPNTMILQALEDTEPDDWPGGPDQWEEAHEKAHEMLSLGYQRILTFEGADGGFGLYPVSRFEIMPTAYGLLQLAEMSRVHDVDPAVIERNVEWLARQQEDDGSWSSESSPMRATAFAVIALSRASSIAANPAVTERAVAFLEENLDDVEANDTLALVANALIEGGHDGAAQRALQRLADNAQRTDGKVYWDAPEGTHFGGFELYARRETTAIAATALLASGFEPDLSQAALQTIASERDPIGGWGTTQATVWSLMALRQNPRAADSSTLNLTVNDQPMPHAAGNDRPGEVVIDNKGQALSSLRHDELAGGVHDLTISTSENSNATYRATAEYAVPWSSAEQVRADEISLSLELPDEPAMRSDLVEATASLENTAETRHATLIVELPVSPGAFVPSAQFEAMVEAETIDHFEILPTHIRLYLAGLEVGEELEFPYQFVPMLTGDFIMPPLRAYRFYTPRPIFEIDGGELRVR